MSKRGAGSEGGEGTGVDDSGDDDVRVGCVGGEWIRCELLLCLCIFSASVRRQTGSEAKPISPSSLQLAPILSSQYSRLWVSSK